MKKLEKINLQLFAEKSAGDSDQEQPIMFTQAQVDAMITTRVSQEKAKIEPTLASHFYIHCEYCKQDIADYHEVCPNCGAGLNRGRTNVCNENSDGTLKQGIAFHAFPCGLSPVSRCVCKDGWWVYEKFTVPIIKDADLLFSSIY